MAKAIRSVSIKTPEFRGAFVAVFSPDKDPNGKEKYGATMLYPEGADLTPLRQILAEVIQKKWPDAASRPGDIILPFRNGNEVPWEGFADHQFAKASSLYKPGVVGPDARIIEDMEQGKVKSGDFFMAIIHAFSWEYMGKNGVSFGLEHIQKTQDGDSLGGGGTDAASAFTPIQPVAAGGSGAQPVGGDALDAILNG